VATGEVENLRARLEREPLDDEVDLTGRPLGVTRRDREVVTGEEGLVPARVDVRAYAPSPSQ
jgi:hypothetical protein